MKGFKVALAVPKITNGLNRNKKIMCSYIRKAYKKGVKLILFPECVISGIVDNGLPSHDIKISISKDDEFIKKLCRLASLYKINIAFGALENAENKFYDSLFFINDRGKVEEIYRRISLWHSNDKEVYRCGDDYKVIKIGQRKFTFLICGDLFFKDVVEGVKNIDFDYLLYSVAISFDNNDIDKNVQWEKEREEYKKRVKDINKITLMTNYIAPKDYEYECYGGAIALSKDGEVIKELPIMKKGILYIQL